jgi:hypothetical protein
VWACALPEILRQHGTRALCSGVSAARRLDSAVGHNSPRFFKEVFCCLIMVSLVRKLVRTGNSSGPKIAVRASWNTGQPTGREKSDVIGCGERCSEISESAVRAGSSEAGERTRDAIVRPLRQRPPGAAGTSREEQTIATTLWSREFVSCPTELANALNSSSAVSSDNQGINHECVG